MQDATPSNVAATNSSNLTTEGIRSLGHSAIVIQNGDECYKFPKHIRSAHGIHDDFFDKFTSVDNETPAEESEELPVSFLDSALASKSEYESEPPVNCFSSEVTGKTTAKPTHPCAADIVLHEDKTSAVESKSSPVPRTSVIVTNIIRDSELPLDKIALTSKSIRCLATFNTSTLELADVSPAMLPALAHLPVDDKPMAPALEVADAADKIMTDATPLPLADAVADAVVKVVPSATVKIPPVTVQVANVVAKAKLNPDIAAVAATMPPLGDPVAKGVPDGIPDAVADTVAAAVSGVVAEVMPTTRMKVETDGMAKAVVKAAGKVVAVTDPADEVVGSAMNYHVASAEATAMTDIVPNAMTDAVANALTDQVAEVVDKAKFNPNTAAVAATMAEPAVLPSNTPKAVGPKKTKREIPSGCMSPVRNAISCKSCFAKSRVANSRLVGPSSRLRRRIVLLSLS